MVEVGVNGRAVVGEVEKVSWSVGHVVVGEGLGGGKCGGGVVDNVLVRRVGGKDLEIKRNSISTKPKNHHCNALPGHITHFTSRTQPWTHILET